MKTPVARNRVEDIGIVVAKTFDVGMVVCGRTVAAWHQVSVKTPQTRLVKIDFTDGTSAYATEWS